MSSFMCEICNASFRRNYSLIHHVQNAHENVRYTCEKCDKQFTKIIVLITHQSTEKGRLQCEMNIKRKNIAAKATSGAAASSSSAAASSSGAATSSSVVQEISTSSETDVRYCDDCNITVRKNYWNYHLRTNDHKQNSGRQIELHGFVSRRSLYEKRVESLTYVNQNVEQIMPEVFLEELEPSLHLLLCDMLTKHEAIKWNLELFAKYIKMVDEESEISVKSHQTKMVRLLKVGEIEEMIEQKRRDILAKMSEFQERDSGWTLVQIMHIEVNINQFKAIAGSNYIPLPPKLQSLKACINVQNNDEFCFKWAIISALKRVVNKPHKCSTYNVSNIIQDIIHIENNDDEGCGGGEFLLDFRGLSFPLSVNDIDKFEQMNPLISINVFGYDDDIKKIVGPYHITKEEKRNHINLLLLIGGDDNRSHYVWIKNISR